jgi:hypothetical protein
MIDRDDIPFAHEREAAIEARMLDVGADPQPIDQPSRQELRDEQREYDKWYVEWARQGENELPRWVHGRGFTDTQRDEDEVF